MKKFIPLLMLVATVVALFVILFTCSSNDSFGNQRYVTMVVDMQYKDGTVKIGKREYDSEVTSFDVNLLDEKINMVAKQGWELVSITPITGCYYGPQIGTFRPVTQKLIYTFRKL